MQNITPYLGLRSRMSQIWINRWTVLLFLVLVRTLLAIVGLNNQLGSAKTEALSACAGVESMGSAMASMPHYLSTGVNDLAAMGVERTVHGLMSMLLLTVTGLEELLVFYINMLTSTYLCLITLVVSGSLHVALKVIEEASDFVNSTIKGISHDIGTGIDDFTDNLNKFTSKLNSIPAAFGDKSTIPKIDVQSSLDKLNNLQLPSSLDQDLTKLNSSIPTFEDVQNFTDNVIRFPFEEVKKLVNGSLQFSFNRSAFPVPEKKQLSFCSGNNGISNFFDGLADVVQTARRAFIAVLVIVAILICIPMAYQEIRRWRTMQQRAKLVGDQSLDSLDVVYIASRPYTATAGIKAAAPFHDSKRQILVRWVIAYATSPPALFVLSLGITGLLACLCQYILLKAVEKEVPVIANQVGDFADTVVHTLRDASAAWANGTNGAILHVNDNINHDVFGWVNTTTVAVNDSLNVFIEQTTAVLNTTFGDTILYEPVTGLFNCLIGLKVAGVQKGLTWVSDHAHVDFPLMPNDTFSAGASESISADSNKNASDSFLASPGSEATDKITNAVVKVTTRLAEELHTEALISGAVVLIWVFIALLGLIRAVYLSLRRERVRAEGGPDPSSTVRPFSSIIRGPAPAYDAPHSTSSNSPRPTSSASNWKPMRSVRRPPPPPPPAAAAAAGGTRSAEDSDSGVSGWRTDEGYPDEKAGHAGFRGVAVSASPEPHTAGERRSVYPTVEKS